MPDRLPGMPLGPDDVFVCRIEDGDPGPVRLELLQTAPRDLRGRWLVLALCGSCVERTGYYCSAHRPPGVKGKRPQLDPLDAGRSGGVSLLSV